MSVVPQKIYPEGVDDLDVNSSVVETFQLARTAVTCGSWYGVRGWTQLHCCPFENMGAEGSNAQRCGSPEVLRVFLRHNRELFADLGRMLFDIFRRFFSQAAGRSLRCAMVSSATLWRRAPG